MGAAIDYSIAAPTYQTEGETFIVTPTICYLKRRTFISSKINPVKWPNIFCQLLYIVILFINNGVSSL